jgi:peptide/nickel transport system substrate-binding protein/microcin C transport system substrate-binding protein
MKLGWQKWEEIMLSRFFGLVLGILSFGFLMTLSTPALSAPKAKTAASVPAVQPNVKAPQGGSVTTNFLAEPSSLHPITSVDLYSHNIHDLVLASLLTKDPETYEWKPYLAEKWEISKDGKVFTFHLRKNITFHDGHPLTAEDVKFSFDAIFEPKYNAAHKRPYYEQISRVEVVDPYTVKFFAKSVYFQNFDICAGMYVIPKHIYSDVEKSKKMNKELIGEGPYKLEKYERGQRIILKKYDNWFGKDDPQFKGEFNFETLNFRFVKEQNVYLEMVKRGDIDYGDLTPEQYAKKTEGDPWGKTVLKVKADNKEPKGYRFVGWNLRNELFKDRDVRMALAMLMNREEMNQKFRYGLSVLATGPTDYFSDYASPNVKPVPFDPKKAAELLSKAGWKDSNKDGVLDKMVNGKRLDFRFSVAFANKDFEKYLTFYKEDLKKAGIDMEVRYLEWNSFLKTLDEGKFEGICLAWMTTFEFDPKQVWHSSSAVQGGSNFIGYKNPEVDQLIDRARGEMNRQKRIILLRKVYEAIAHDAPYVFMFNEKYDFYAASAKLGRPGDTFKYSVGSDYWWMNP